jgi:hypothetical protein
MRKVNLRSFLIAAMLAIGFGSIYSVAQSSRDSNGTNKLEGCIVKQASEFYIVPATGAATKLNAGDQNLSAHEGHNVRLTGKMQSSTASSAGQTGASQAGTSSQTGTSTASGGTEPEFLVARVDMIESQCPADIQKRIDQSKEKSTPK